MNEIVMEITPEMEGERIDKCISNYLESLFRRSSKMERHT